VRKLFGHKVDKLTVLVTPTSINFIEKVKDKKQFVLKIVQKIKIADITGVSLSSLADCYLVIHHSVKDQEEPFVENLNKTEFISVLNDQYKKIHKTNIKVNIGDTVEYRSNAKGKKKTVAWSLDKTDKAKAALLAGSSSKWTVSIAQGLPADTKPKAVEKKSAPVKSQSQQKTSTNNNVKKSTPQLGVMESDPETQRNERTVQLKQQQKQQEEQKIKSQQQQQSTQAPKKGAPPPPKRKDARPKCKALYDYDAQGSDEISLKVDDVIFVLQKSDTGWWEGELNGKKGLFPGNYVEELK
jgi:myosin-1